MYVYAGIDEAGYGPLFGPLVVGCAVFTIEDHPDPACPPDLWHLLRRAVSKKPAKRAATIAVNDSKKLYSPAAGLRHLETTALTFAQLASHQPATLRDWLNALTPQEDRPDHPPPWYQPVDNTIPTSTTTPRVDIASNVLKVAANEARVLLPHLAATPVFEDRFNQMTAATRSKAAVNFTFVTKHLTTIWNRFAAHHPNVVIDRQSGRTRYRELLCAAFPGTHLSILEESPTTSTYHLHTKDAQAKRMTVSFQTSADEHHLPTALASILAKYTRELLMARFNAYFTDRIPSLKPTAGYATDGKRFWNDIQPHLPQLNIEPSTLRRAR